MRRGLIYGVPNNTLDSRKGPYVNCNRIQLLFRRPFNLFELSIYSALQCTLEIPINVFQAPFKYLVHSWISLKYCYSISYEFETEMGNLNENHILRFSWCIFLWKPLDRWIIYFFRTLLFYFIEETISTSAQLQIQVKIKNRKIK